MFKNCTIPFVGILWEEHSSLFSEPKHEIRDPSTLITQVTKQIFFCLTDSKLQHILCSKLNKDQENHCRQYFICRVQACTTLRTTTSLTSYCVKCSILFFVKKLNVPNHNPDNPQFRIYTVIHSKFLSLMNMKSQEREKRGFLP